MNKSDVDVQLELLLWYKCLSDTTNASFLPLYDDHSRYLVLKGGAGSGKSIFAGRKVLERCVREPGHRFLVCRKVKNTIKGSCFKQLVDQLAEHYPEVTAKANWSDYSITFDNGSEIICCGLDNPEKLKSIYKITGIWVEEASELQAADLNQLNLRLRGKTDYYKQIILTFNPISILHWLKTRFFDDPAPNVRLHESTYKDNHFLLEYDPEYLAELESYKDYDEYYYNVYCLGQWGITGRTIFDARAVTERILDDIQPQRVGYFDYDYDGISISNIRFIDDKDGYIAIYKAPEDGRPYVIGGDTAGDGSDSFTLQVLDNIDAAQVARLKCAKLEEPTFARQAYCLGVFYNSALIGLETNWSTYPVLELERLRYPKQYVRETIDDFTHKVKLSYGFWTGSKTRPVIIATLIKVAAEDLQSICDRATLEEMLTFVRTDDMRPEAEEGAHDDLIMALAIAHYIRPQMRMYIEDAANDSGVWTSDMIEDYNNAPPAERQYLIKKWGKPRRR